MIRVVFFASIREGLGIPGLDLEPGDIANTVDLIARLRARGAPWGEVLGREDMLVAVNQTMVEPGAPVTDGDEVAFFPPVTGG